MKKYLLISLIPSISFATNFVPLSGSEFNNVFISSQSPAGGSINALFNSAYSWGVGIAIILAVIFIMYGGFLYLTSDVFSNKSAGKEAVKNAFLGLLIVLGSYAILFTINPEILKSTLDLSRLSQPISNPGGPGGANPGVPGQPGGGNPPGGTPNLTGQTITPRVTAYSPQRDGSSTQGMEGGYASSIAGLDGHFVVRTLDDYSNGRSNYITLAGDPSEYRKSYVIPSITYRDNNGNQKTLTNVRGYVHDTGSAFTGAGNTKFDIPVGRDYTNQQQNTQPFLTSNIQFIKQ